MTPRTKIVATLGPSSEDKGVIRELIKAGMNVARLNFSHGNYDQFKKIVKNIREIEKELNVRISLMQDLQGPKIRLGVLLEPIKVKKGQNLSFSSKKTNKNCIQIPSCSILAKVVKKGQSLLINDGLIRTKIVSIKDSVITVKVMNSGLLESCKGVNIPDSSLAPSISLTKKDKKDLEFGIKTLKVDAVAISFVERAENINFVRKQISKHSKRPVALFAKIERKEALKNLESIIHASDGVMVARGDLGIETQAEAVPIQQKRIIALARQKGKPVVIATQILQSMVKNPLPTRAEISDAAHAIFEHADAFMLSNESAIGEYPIEAVKTLSEVAQISEEAIFQERELFPIPPLKQCKDIEDESMALNACRIADEIDANTLVVLTKNGFTARHVLKHRPKTKVIIVTPNKKQMAFLNMLWGSRTVLHYTGKFRSEEAKDFLKKQGYLKKGDDIVSIKLSDNKRSLVMMHV